MLEVKNLTFGFGKKPLFTNLSFTVGTGELIRIDGHNGSGKSTLIAVICGLLGGQQGNIHFKGEDDFRQWTSWIAPDANGLFPTLSAVSNLDFWLNLREQSTPSSSIKDSLASWGINGDWLQSGLPTAKFSTGMKRRLALCRLQLEKSRLWIIDEPLFGLDEKACQKFKTLLHEHLAGGGATIIVTHDARILEGIKHSTVFLGGA
jgi:heme exporter protein A